MPRHMQAYRMCHMAAGLATITGTPGQGQRKQEQMNWCHVSLQA